MHSSAHYELLRDRYVARSRAKVQGVLKTRKRVLYDDLWDLALSQPMTWECDIKDWIRQWIKSGRIEPEGWRPKQRGFLSRIGATLAGLMADKPLIVSDLRD